MDIISDTRAIRCIIVIPVNTKLIPAPHCHLCNIRHQIIRNTVWVFPNQTALVCPKRIKVAQKYYIIFRVRCMHVRQNLFQHTLRPPIRIRTLPLWALLRHRNNRRVAVHRSRGGKNQVLTPMFAQDIKQNQRTVNIIVIIIKRKAD